MDETEFFAIMDCRKGIVQENLWYLQDAAERRARRLNSIAAVDLPDLPAPKLPAFLVVRVTVVDNAENV